MIFPCERAVAQGYKTRVKSAETGHDAEIFVAAILNKKPSFV